MKAALPWLGKLSLILAGISTVQAADDVRVAAVPDNVRAQFRLSPFYTKYVSAGGIPVLSSAKVSDFALLEARYLILQLIGHRPDVLAAIAKNKVRFAVMAPTELTTDIPEHSDLTPKDHWDKRARGLGATDARPAVSSGEENLLGYKGDPYAVENILIHEFGHVIHERGMNSVDATFDQRLRAAYEAAKRAGLWKGTYAGSNHMEYWAEGVQSWFDTNRENDSEHNQVNTRAELKAYDQKLAAILTEVFGDREWRYAVPAKRSPPSAHLAGFEPAKAPSFAWPARLGGGAKAVAETPMEIPAGGTLVGLAPGSRASWKSVSAGGPTKIKFQNSTDSTITLDWMDYEGRPKTYFTLRKGEQTEASTYVGHVWRAKNERGTVIAYFVGGTEAGTAVVKAP